MSDEKRMDVSHESLRKYLNYLKERRGLTRTTIGNYKGIIKGYLNWIDAPRRTCYFRNCNNQTVDECAVCSNPVCEKHSIQLEFNYLWHVCDTCRKVESNWREWIKELDEELYEDMSEKAGRVSEGGGERDGERWTEREIEYLKGNLYEIPAWEIGEELRRTKVAVFSKAHELGIWSY